MLNRFFCLAVLGTGMLTTATYAATSIDTRIDAVTVYPQGATITHIARVTLSAGETAVELTDLPADLSMETLRVETSGKDVVIGQVRILSEPLRDAVNAEVRKLQEELRTLQNRMNALDDSTKAANLRLKFLDSLASGYGKGAWARGVGSATNTNEWINALNALDTGANAAHKTIRDNALARAELEQDASVVQRKLNAVQGHSRAADRVALTLASASAQTVDVRVHYFQHNAYWRPVYEARLASDTGKLDLLHQAIVAQSTEAAWDNVRVTLSTSDPTGDLEAPELASEFVDFWQPRPEVREAPAFAGRAKLMDSMVQMEEVVVTAARRTDVQNTNFAVNYTLPGRVNIPNDSDEDRVFDLNQYVFDTSLITRVVPRESTLAFLTAEFTYSENEPLAGSDMRVFVDNVFAGVSHLPPLSPKDKVTIPMGQDRRVGVRVEDQGGQEEEGGFIGRTRTERSDYLFEITNHRSAPTRVEVHDRYPVARHKDIEIEIPDTATAPDTKDLKDRPGIVVWSKQLDGGEVWRIRHQYEISYPADRQIMHQ